MIENLGVIGWQKAVCLYAIGVAIFLVHRQWIDPWFNHKFNRPQRRRKMLAVVCAPLPLLVFRTPLGLIGLFVLLALIGDENDDDPPKRKRRFGLLREWAAKVREWMKPPVPLPEPK